jgi:uncharacterized phiE125 gp8 family phage protein
VKRIILTAPTVKPVELFELKTHLGVTDSDRDKLLSGYLSTAIEHVESVTGRKLITQTWKLVLDGPVRSIELPYGQLQSVSSIVYIDSDESPITVSTSDYYVGGVGTDEGDISFVSTFSFPALYDYEPITITFVCGYGIASAVPEAFKSAILLFAQDLFLGGKDNQEAVKNIYTPKIITWGYK